MRAKNPDFSKRYKVTKLGNVENPYHENSDFGESKPFHVGTFISAPEEGNRFNLGYIDYQNSGISTSPVVKILEDGVFHTLNSIYKYEPYNG